MSRKEHWCALLQAERVFISQNAMMMMRGEAALPVFLLQHCELRILYFHADHTIIP